jgi:hypothetical protein
VNGLTQEDGALVELSVWSCLLSENLNNRYLNPNWRNAAKYAPYLPVRQDIDAMRGPHDSKPFPENCSMEQLCGFMLEDLRASSAECL